MGRRSDRTPEQRQAFRDALAEGKSIKDAKLAAGYSLAVANKGKTGLSRELASAFAEMKKTELADLVALSKMTSTDDIKHAVRGRITTALAEGSDKGIAAAKLAGSLTETGGMFQHEVLIGVQINQLSPGTERLITLEAEGE
jgi:hypothetical protein